MRRGSDLVFGRFAAGLLAVANEVEEVGQGQGGEARVGGFFGFGDELGEDLSGVEGATVVGGFVDGAAFQKGDDGVEGDLFGGKFEGIAAVDATFAFEKATVFEGQEDLFEILFRNVGGLGDLGDLGPTGFGWAGAEVDEGPDGVLAFFRDFHGVLIGRVGLDLREGDFRELGGGAEGGAGKGLAGFESFEAGADGAFAVHDDGSFEVGKVFAEMENAFEDFLQDEVGFEGFAFLGEFVAFLGPEIDFKVLLLGGSFGFGQGQGFEGGKLDVFDFALSQFDGGGLGFGSWRDCPDGVAADGDFRGERGAAEEGVAAPDGHARLGGFDFGLGHGEFEADVGGFIFGDDDHLFLSFPRGEFDADGVASAFEGKGDGGFANVFAVEEDVGAFGFGFDDEFALAKGPGDGLRWTFFDDDFADEDGVVGLAETELIGAGGDVGEFGRGFVGFGEVGSDDFEVGSGRIAFEEEGAELTGEGDGAEVGEGLGGDFNFHFDGVVAGQFDFDGVGLGEESFEGGGGGHDGVAADTDDGALG